MFDSIRAIRRWLSLAVVAAAALLVAPAGALALQVSLGDSFSSGEGAGRYDEATASWFKGGNGCHRSRRAWPRLLGVVPAAHLACSGARTGNLIDSGKKEPDRISQLDRLRELVASGDVSRVFVTIGGNDLGFRKIFTACVNPFKEPCLGRIDAVELQRLREDVLPLVIEALEKIKLIALPADVVLVGYPDLIPDATEPMAGCTWWLSPIEAPRVRRLERALDSTMRAAAREAVVDFVSIRSALDDHELCGPDPWVKWFSFKKVFTGKLLPQEMGHPTYEGQRAIARLVSERL